MRCVLLCLIGWVGAVQAQNLQTFEPATNPAGLLSTDSPTLVGAGRIAPALWINYANRPVVLRDGAGGVREVITADWIAVDALATWGITDRFEAALHLPIAWVDGPGLAARGQTATTLGDVRAVLRAQFAEPLTLSLAARAPTGDPDRFAGSAGWTIEPELVVGHRWGRTALMANAGVRLRTATDAVLNLNLNHEWTWAVGALQGLGAGWGILAEAYGSGPLGEVLDDTVVLPVEGMAGVRWRSAMGLQATAGGGVGINPDRGVPRFRVLVGIAWQPVDQPPPPPPVDQDGDGLLPPADACPADPEDADGFQDADGCPDLDNDGDGIFDRDDRCPLRPETRNGVDDADGCPDTITDMDGDGILDPQDKCPRQAEDRDGFEDADGCPDVDDDGDGIPDSADACRRQPETRNGFQDEDGCPDTKLSLVKVQTDDIVILEKVYFRTNKAIIQRRSHRVLDQVAEVMRVYTHIKGVEVQGHTDARGSRAHNQDLSQRRAEAVRAYLMRKGIAGRRLMANGYGEDTPIAPNRTRAGRAKNRRVEFKIDRDGDGIIDAQDACREQPGDGVNGCPLK